MVRRRKSQSERAIVDTWLTVPLANRQHIRFDKHVAAVHGPDGTTLVKHVERVLSIRARRHPFKVVRMIVGSNAIFMIDLMMRRRTRTVERGTDEHMNMDTLATIALVDPTMDLRSSTDTTEQLHTGVSGGHAATQDDAIGAPTHVAMRTDVVATFVASDRHPLFHMEQHSTNW